MPRIAASVAIILLAAAPALAQSIGEPLPGRSHSREKFRPAAPERSARACPEYGPGFVRLEGSSFCVRAGGAVRVEFGKSSGNRHGSSGFGSSSGGLVQLEGRGETSLGPVRTIVRMRGQIDRGLESGPFRY